MNIKQRYQSYHKNLITELTSVINDVIKSVEEVTSFLPEKEIMDIFNNNPKSNLMMSWNITESSDEIYFTFDHVQVGDVYPFEGRMIKKFDEFLKKYYPNIVICNCGKIILPESFLLIFKFSTEIENKKVVRFQEDIEESFPNSRFQQYYRNGDYLEKIHVIVPTN